MTRAAVRRRRPALSREQVAELVRRIEDTGGGLPPHGPSDDDGDRGPDDGRPSWREEARMWRTIAVYLILYSTALLVLAAMWPGWMPVHL